MRTLSVVLFALALAVVAGAAGAQSVCVPSTTQPSVTTQAPVVSQAPSMIVPAGCGAGPVNALATLQAGPMFDQQYAQIQYQLHGDEIALANMGQQKATDPNLRSFSEKVIKERIAMNEKLAQLYPQVSSGGVLTYDAARVESIRGPFLSLSGGSFDQAYVAGLISVMQDSIRVANEGTLKLTNGTLFDQSNITQRTNYNEIKALRNWQATGKLTK